MTLRLTPEILVGSYDFLRLTPPFNTWGLPESDDVEFTVSRCRSRMGYCTARKHQRGSWEIGISECWVSHTFTLLQIMGHEMTHLKQQKDRTETPNTEHNAEFRQLGKLVCRHHGWDPMAF